MAGARLLFDLAQLIEAGLAPAQAVARIEAGGKREQRALARLSGDLRRGRPLAHALTDAGFAGGLEAAVVRIGEQAGKLDEALRYLAERHERRRLRIAGLRARLWLPNVVLGIVLLIGVVRATTAGVAWTAALFEAGLIAAVVVGLTYAIVAALSRDSTNWLAFAWQSGLVRSSTLVRRYFEHCFFTAWKWLTDAGVDFVAGTATLGALIDDRGYRRAIERYRAALKRGSGVGEALQGAGLLQSGELFEVMRTAESAGRLVPALARYLDDEQSRLDRVTDAIHAWAPRAYYVFALVLGGAQLR